MTGSSTHIGRGIYDVVEVARLVRRRRAAVEAWVRSGSGRREPLLTGEFGGYFSFLDLVSLQVIAELDHRGVSRKEISRGSIFLSEQLGTNRPFAHRELATVGRSFFANLGAWVDAGQRGQGAFTEIITPLLRPIEFGTDGLARIWRPHLDVWINPEIQAGEPCIDRTRVPTRVLADLATAETDHRVLADDYGLMISQVKAALEYERELETAA